MAIISAVRTGEITITSGSGTTINETISSVDTSRSTISYFARNGATTGGSNRLLRHIFKAALTSSTNLQFVRNSATSATTVTLRYVVIEWDASAVISVQSGNFNASTDPHDVTLGTSVTPGNCVPFFTWMTNENNPILGNVCTAHVADADTLRFDFGAAPSTDDFDCNWILVEFDPSKVAVQTGEISMAANTFTGTAAISSVDLAKSVVLNGGTRRTISPPGSAALCRLHLSSTTQVTATRHNSGTDTGGLTVRYYVLTAVETGLTAVTGNATIDSATSVNPTFSEIVADWIAPISLHPFGNCYLDGTSTNNEGQFMYSLALGSPPDDVTLQRDGSTDDLHINYAILAQAAAASDDGLLMLLHNGA